MKNLLSVGLVSLVLACSSKETKCNELGVELERIRNEIEMVRPKYCPTTAMIGMYLGLYLCNGDEELFKALEAKYRELRDTHYEECNQVQF